MSAAWSSHEHEIGRGQATRATAHLFAALQVLELRLRRCAADPARRATFACALPDLWLSDLPEEGDSVIFSPELARAILSGRKTTVRIPIRPSHQHVWTDAQGRTHRQTVCPYRVGHSYAIQPGGKSAIGRFLVRWVDFAQLDALDYSEARAEGFKTQRDFYDHWLRTHGYIDPAQAVWVIRFTVDTDSDRFLAPAGQPPSDYTSNVHRSLEPVPVVPREVQAEMSREASERDDQMRREWLREREQMTLSERVRSLEGLRNGRRADVSRELRVISDRIERAERQIGGDK